MLEIPGAEKKAFLNLVTAQARQVGMSPTEYVRKIWYHEQAAKVGEYVALGLVEQLTTIIDNRAESIGQGSDPETEL